MTKNIRKLRHKYETNPPNEQTIQQEKDEAKPDTPPDQSTRLAGNATTLPPPRRGEGGKTI